MLVLQYDKRTGKFTGARLVLILTMGQQWDQVRRNAEGKMNRYPEPTPSLEKREQR